MNEECAIMATDYSPQLQMKDIYDLAQKVGEQFHHLLSQFGNTYLAEHISTVVKALEYLETTFEENQRLQVKNGKLMLDNDNLAREIRELSTTVKVGLLLGAWVGGMVFRLVHKSVQKW